MNGKSTKWRELARDIFLGSIALVILFDQVFLVPSAQPILIFLVIFLFGCIPFLRGDKKREGEYGPFVRIIMTLLGVKLPGNFEEADHDSEFVKRSQGPGRGPSHSNGPEQQHGSTSASSPEDLPPLPKSS